MWGRSKEMKGWALALTGLWRRTEDGGGGGRMMQEGLCDGTFPEFPATKS